jgi:hypothetical protein
VSECPRCGKALQPLQHDKRDWLRIAENRAHVYTCAPDAKSIKDQAMSNTDAPRVPNHILRNLADVHSNSEVRSIAAELLALRTPAQAAGVTVGEDRLAHLIHAFDVMQTCSPFLTTEAAHETRDLLRELQRLRSQPPAAQVCGMHPDADPSMYDAVQHRLNGGPYCYHVDEDRKYCGRAQRWDGHGLKDFHEFVAIPRSSRDVAPSLGELELVEARAIIEGLEAVTMECGDDDEWLRARTSHAAKFLRALAQRADKGK